MRSLINQAVPRCLALRPSRSQLAIIAAGALWGTGPVLIRHLQSGGISSMTIIFLRSLGAWLLMLAWAVRNRDQSRVAKKDLPLILGLAMAGPALSQPLFIYSVTAMSVAIASILNYTSPVFGAILARFLYGELFTPRKISALVLTFAGLGLVSGAWQALLKGGLAAPPLALAAGLGSGFFYAVYTILLKPVVKKYHPLTIQTWNTGFGLPILLLYASWRSSLSFPADATGWLSAALNSIGPGFVAFVLFTRGVAAVPAGHVLVLASVEPIAACLLGVALLGESLAAGQWVGIVLMLVGISAISEPERQGPGQPMGTKGPELDSVPLS